MCRHKHGFRDSILLDGYCLGVSPVAGKATNGKLMKLQAVSIARISALETLISQHQSKFIPHPTTEASVMSPFPISIISSQTTLSPPFGTRESSLIFLQGNRAVRGRLHKDSSFPLDMMMTDSRMDRTMRTGPRNFTRELLEEWKYPFILGLPTGKWLACSCWVAVCFPLQESDIYHHKVKITASLSEKEEKKPEAQEINRQGILHMSTSRSEAPSGPSGSLCPD